MATIDKSVYEDLHNKYEKLKIVCKECFLKSAEQKTDNEMDELSQRVEMLELDKSFDGVVKALDEILAQIDKSNEHYVRIVAMKSSIHYEQAKTLVNNNKELIAKDLLEKALNLLTDYIKHPGVCFLYLRVTNHYSYLLSKNNELDKACALLEDAKIVYQEVKNTPVKIFNSDDLFVPELVSNLREDTVLKLEKLVTNNLQMLGWVYSKQGMHKKFAVYHHEVLKRQLEMRDGSALIWALKTARLASYFLSTNNFVQARHHLAAASIVLEEYEIDLKKYEMTEPVVLKWKELQHYYADVAKCWVKYGLYLFNVSKMQTVQSFYGDNSQCLEDLWVSPFGYLNSKSKPKNVDAEEKEKVKEKTADEKENGENSESSDRIAVSPEGDTKPVELENDTTKIKTGATGDANNVDESQKEAQSNDDKETESLLEFPTLKLTSFENQVSCKFIKTTEEARRLFLFTHTWLKRSKVFYTIKDHPLEYINAILDLSELYRYLAFYEDDVESQYSVQKRRSDSLETLSSVLREVRPQCYVAVSIELLRELAEVQLEMMGLNLRRLYMAQDGNTSRESTLHKMEAVADIHARLEQFGEGISQGALGQDDLDVEEATTESDGDESETETKKSPEVSTTEELSSKTDSTLVT